MKGPGQSAWMFPSSNAKTSHMKDVDLFELISLDAKIHPNQRLNDGDMAYTRFVAPIGL